MKRDKLADIVFLDHDYWFVLISEADYPEFVHDVVSTMSGDWRCELRDGPGASGGFEDLMWLGPDAPASGITILASEHPEGIMLQISAPEDCDKITRTLVEQLLKRGTLFKHAPHKRSKR